LLHRGRGVAVTHCSPFATGRERLYDGAMNKDKHTLRLAVVMTAVVAALFVLAVGQFTHSDSEGQQAAVLRAYAE
jgi:hypothetical protein